MSLFIPQGGNQVKDNGNRSTFPEEKIRSEIAKLINRRSNLEGYTTRNPAQDMIFLEGKNLLLKALSLYGDDGSELYREARSFTEKDYLILRVNIEPGMQYFIAFPSSIHAPIQAILIKDSTNEPIVFSQSGIDITDLSSIFSDTEYQNIQEAFFHIVTQGNNSDIEYLRKNIGEAWKNKLIRRNKKTPYLQEEKLYLNTEMPYNIEWASREFNYVLDLKPKRNDRIFGILKVGEQELQLIIEFEDHRTKVILDPDYDSQHKYLFQTQYTPSQLMSTIEYLFQTKFKRDNGIGAEIIELSPKKG